MRKKLICGNWKMNQSCAEIKNFFAEMAKHKGTYSADAWVSPQFIHLAMVQELARPLNIKVGAQNCAYKDSGAFTGEVSPLSLKDMNVDFTIIGHSERRTIYKEDDKVLNEKTLLALKNGLQVIFCVGETLEEREAGKTEAVVEKQTLEGLKNIPEDKRADVIIAYEPVWAIGTGKNATKEQAQEVHAFIRNKLLSRVGFNAQKTLVLYGGSVKPSNIAELISQKDIDGALVGGASLKAQDFYQLCLGKAL